MRLDPENRQLGSLGLVDQGRVARRRATLIDVLETRFQGISSSCSLVAATTALRKRDFNFILASCSFWG